MIIETNFPDDEEDRRITSILTQGQSLQGPKLKAFGKKHAERLKKTKKTGSSLLARYLETPKGEESRLRAALKRRDS